MDEGYDQGVCTYMMKIESCSFVKNFKAGLDRDAHLYVFCGRKGGCDLSA